MENIEGKKLICYRCGSDNTLFMMENSDSTVYKCLNCGKVIIKYKHRNGKDYGKQ